MPVKRSRVFSRGFKLAAVTRMETGAAPGDPAARRGRGLLRDDRRDRHPAADLVPDIDSLNRFLMEAPPRMEGVRDVRTSLVPEAVRRLDTAPTAHPR